MGQANHIAAWSIFDPERKQLSVLNPDCQLNGASSKFFQRAAIRPRHFAVQRVGYDRSAGGFREAFYHRSVKASDADTDFTTTIVGVGVDMQIVTPQDNRLGDHLAAVRTPIK